jgi:hypothetical protein
VDAAVAIATTVRPKFLLSIFLSCVVVTFGAT